jgi:hypothetical protein
MKLSTVLKIGAVVGIGYVVLAVTAIRSVYGPSPKVIK